MGIAFLGEIPLVGSIREMSDAGTPVTAIAPDSAEAKAYFTLAEEVARSLKAPLRAAPRIVLE
jgi:ATP-binding protein involved in chromosome partitioning